MQKQDCQYIKSIQNLLDNKKIRNSMYSQRALARDIGIDPGDLTRILQGKKNITCKLAYKIGIALELGPQELLAFLEPTLKS